MEDLRSEINVLKAKIDSQNILISYLMAIQAKEAGADSINQIYGLAINALSNAPQVSEVGQKEAAESFKRAQNMAASAFSSLGEPEPLPSNYDRGVEAGLRAILLAIIFSHPNKEGVVELIRLGSNKTKSDALFESKDTDRYQLGLDQTIELLLEALEKQSE